MMFACNTLRWLTVGALAISLSVAPVCMPAVASGCQMSAAKHVGHVGAQCCCGDHCDCLNCEADHGRSNDSQNSPTIPNDSRDLAKVGQAVVSFAVSLTHCGQVRDTASHAVSLPPLQTLVAQHTCLRV